MLLVFIPWCNSLTSIYYWIDFRLESFIWSILRKTSFIVKYIHLSISAETKPWWSKTKPTIPNIRKNPKPTIYNQWPSKFVLWIRFKYEQIQFWIKTKNIYILNVSLNKDITPTFLPVPLLQTEHLQYNIYHSVFINYFEHVLSTTPPSSTRQSNARLELFQKSPDWWAFYWD